MWQLPASASEQSGSVDILAMLTWLENHGYVPRNDTLDAVKYGWEICSTGGVNENFQVSKFSITTTPPGSAGNSAEATIPSTGSPVTMAWSNGSDCWGAITVEAQPGSRR
jgi:hypothetical protein